MPGTPDLLTFMVVTAADTTTPMIKAIFSHGAGPVADEIARCGGRVFDSSRQRMYAAFPSSGQALAGLLAVQRKLATLALAYGDAAQLQAVLHRGPFIVSGATYTGETLRYAEYLLRAANPGQCLLSQAAAGDLAEALPASVSLRDLGPQRLKDLTRPQRVFQLLAPELAADTRPLHTLDARPHNLPILPSSLIGREQDVANISLLLRNPGVGLVTLLGPSGTGKSRLALQLAAELLDDCRDGVFFVPLMHIADPGLLLPAIAEVLGARENFDETLLESVKQALRGRQLLLILDNFEQLVEQAPLVAELLAEAPQVTCLVTSQRELGLPQEQVEALPPLSLPSSARFVIVESLVRYPAVALYIERARRNLPQFEVTSDNARAVAEICLLLDGLPLAIELAAAYSERFTPQEIIEQLGATLAEPQAAPAGEAEPGPEQQRTLETLLAWSYALLGAPEQTLFARMGVFSGGATNEAIMAVCNLEGDDEQQLAERVRCLLQRSLIRQEYLTADEVRWSMLDMVHDHAEQRLEQRGERALLLRQHAAYFVALAERAEQELRGRHQARWLAQLRQESGNLHQALEWARQQGDMPLLARLASALGFFWQISGAFHEGRRWLGLALAGADPGPSAALPGAPVPQDQLQPAAEQDMPALLARCRRALGRLLTEARRLEEALSYLQPAYNSIQGLGDRRELALISGLIGEVKMYSGLRDEAQQWFERERAISGEIADRSGEAHALSGMACVAWARGDYHQTAEQFELTLQLARELGDYHQHATALYNLGVIYPQLGLPARALECFGQGLQLAREHNLPPVECLILLGMAELYMDYGRPEQALQCCQQGLGLAIELDNQERVAAVVATLARLADSRRHPAAGWLYQQAIEASRTVQPYYHCYMLYYRATYLAEHGQLQEALESAQAAEAVVRQYDLQDPSICQIRLLQIDLQVALGQLSRKQALAELAALRERWDDSAHLARISYLAWKLKPSGAVERQQAGQHYAALYAQQPTLEYRQRYQALTGELLPALELPDHAALLGGEPPPLEQLLEKCAAHFGVPAG